jgi:hypothetical protein
LPVCQVGRVKPIPAWSTLALDLAANRLRHYQAASYKAHSKDLAKRSLVFSWHLPARPKQDVFFIYLFHPAQNADLP